MRFLSTLFLTLIALPTFSQEILSKPLNSKELKREQNVKIYLPKDYEKDTEIDYPLAIVLGDSYLFDLYVGNAKLFAKADKAPQQIIVGIDMTKTYSKDVSVVPATSILTNNALRFYNFIKNELVPYMEGNYRTSPFMTIAGEGKAANFITHFLKDPEPIFNSYLCATPEFQKYSPQLFQSYALDRLGSVDNTYFIYASNAKEFTTDAIFRGFSEIGTFLSSFKAENINVNFDKFPNAPSYLSVISETIPRAFSAMFRLYGRISKSEYEKKIKDLEPLEAIKYLEKKYIDIQYLYGTNLNVRLQDIYAIEGIVMDKQDGDYLRVLGDFVSIKYPDLHIGDYYIGKYYELGKDYERADFYYKAAYGKMDLSNPNADNFYENIKRVNDLLEKQKSRENSDPLEEEEEEEENDDNENENEDN